jgi:hypothetical protein
MSGVLKRMAKQALGELPTVQPLTPPHFAPHTLGLRQAAFEPGTDAGIDAPASILAPRPESRPLKSRETWMDAAEEIRRRSEEFAPSGSLQPRESMPPREPTPPRKTPTRREMAEAERPAERVRPIMRNWEGNPGRGKDPDEAERPTRSKSAEAELEVDTESLAPSEETKLRAVQNGPHPDSGVVPQEHMPQKHRRANSSRDRTEILSEVESNVPISPDRRRQAIEARPAARTESQKRPEPAVAPIEQRTEIHISIGSIELRAPSVEAKPRAAPFRPRVTLDDFLRRKPEAGA